MYFKHGIVERKMVNFLRSVKKLEVMCTRSTCHEHGTRKKNLSPWQELNLWPSVHRSDALTTELQRTRSALGHTQGVSITYANYALISYVRVNVWIAMCDLSIFVPHCWLNYILHDLDYCNLEAVKIHSSSLVAFNLNLLLTGELSIQLFLV